MQPWLQVRHIGEPRARTSGASHAGTFAVTLYFRMPSVAHLHDRAAVRHVICCYVGRHHVFWQISRTKAASRALP